MMHKAKRVLLWVLEHHVLCCFAWVAIGIGFFVGGGKMPLWIAVFAWVLIGLCMIGNYLVEQGQREYGGADGNKY